MKKTKKKSKLPKYDKGGNVGKELKNTGLFLADSMLAEWAPNAIKQDQYSDTKWGKTLGNVGAVHESFSSQSPISKNVSKMWNDGQTGYDEKQMEYYGKIQPIAKVGSKIGEMWTGSALGGANMGAGASGTSGGSAVAGQGAMAGQMFSQGSQQYLNTQYDPMANMHDPSGNDAEGRPQDNPYYAYGGNTQPNAEVEKQENAITPNGQFVQYDGPSHEQGGIPTQLPGGTDVFSDRLKMPGTKKTFAKLNKPNDTSKEDKVLSDTKSNTVAKATASLMKLAKQTNSSKLFQAQEALKQSKIEKYTMRLGGTVKYPDGGKVANVPKDFAYDRKEGNKTFYKKSTTINPATGGSMTTNPNDYNNFLINKLQSGVSPEDLIANKYGDAASIEKLRNYYKPQYVYTEPTVPVVPSVDNSGYRKIDRKEVFNAGSNNPFKTMRYPDANAGYSKGIDVYFDPTTGKEIDAIKSFDTKGSYIPSYIEGSNRNYYSNTEKYETPGMNLDKQKTTSIGNKEAIDLGAFAKGGRVPRYGYGDTTPRLQPIESDEPELLDLDFGYRDPSVEANWNNIQAGRQNTPTYNNGPYSINKTSAQVIADSQGNPMSSSNQNKGNFGNMAMQAGLGIMNNLGNFYDLSRADTSEVDKYDRMNPALLDPTASFRDVENQKRIAEYNIRNASTGHSGAYLANRVGSDVSLVLAKDKIAREYQNMNAGIKNSAQQYNIKQHKAEDIANMQNRAKSRDIKANAISHIGQNDVAQYGDTRRTAADKDKIELIKSMYPSIRNSPEIMEYYKKKGWLTDSEIKELDRQHVSKK